MVQWRKIPDGLQPAKGDIPDSMNDPVVWLQWILIAGIIASSVFSVINSFRSRRSKDANQRALYAAKMNISMGVMLILIAFIQMFVYTGSTLRVIVGAVFMLLGLFNIFAGIRNRSVIRTVMERNAAGKQR
ncbi:YtpI family protein [Paenibacillus pasadenensis]|uniref:YtpI family protein n=1 Tax=Paenibacillus pasadenensis TaxID=217090 RepID=UPI0033427EEE